jgi:hypothetical protein
MGVALEGKWGKDFALLEKKKKKVGDLYGAHLPIGWSIYKVNAYLSLFCNKTEISLSHISTSYRLKNLAHFR